MLRRVDSTIAVASWIAAALAVLMLFVGPQLIAEDKAEQSESATGAAPYSSGGGGGAADGKAVFSGNCSSCHTLSAAGASGQIGPNLDDTSLSAAEIEAIVRDGKRAMPSFGGQLSDDEIKAVAAFIASN